MNIQLPESAEQLASSLADANSAGQSIRLGGAFTKDRMAGPIAGADTSISTARMRRVLQYEPRDLTISVEAGLPFSELTRILAANRQMVPLDPPFGANATVGGVIASNTSGPRRRLYGSARDVVIGMKFATLEGKLVQSGGMVVKNVAGLDMAKLLIGSFGTLAAIATVNFKLAPVPLFERTLAVAFDSLAAALLLRDGMLKGVLQPAALDLLNPAASALLGMSGWTLILNAAGSNPELIARYEAALDKYETVSDQTWHNLLEFTPNFLESNPSGAVVRISTTLTGVKEVMEKFAGPCVARAGSGVCYAYFADAAKATLNGFPGAIEFSPADQKAKLDLWPAPGTDFAMMKKVKDMFDPQHLLNKGRLYGRI
jgi:glycolate oxidase FAD binding subunit